MQVFRVATEKDGKTTKGQGEFSTEVIEVNRYYAALTIEEVWERIKKDIPEYETLIAIIRQQSSIFIINPEESDHD